MALWYCDDFENRLVKVIHPDGGVTQFAYAGDGYDRVWMKKKNGDEILFYYDGERTAAEFNAQGGLLRAYRYGPQVIWMEEGGNIFFLHADGQGSVRAVTNISGQLVAEYSYDAFGNQLEGEEGWNPFKYCGIFGYREDEEIALMKVGARYYDPMIGRWIQKDPILSGFNWWVYCENDPVNGVDPEGTWTKVVKIPFCWSFEWSTIVFRDGKPVREVHDVYVKGYIEITLHFSFGLIPKLEPDVSIEDVKVVITERKEYVYYIPPFP